MARELVAHRWTCPVCSETKTSLATMSTMAPEEQAKYALISHVRTRNRRGHGRAGEYPPEFDPDDALDYIEIRSEVEDRPRELDAVR